MLFSIQLLEYNILLGKQVLVSSNTQESIHSPPSRWYELGDIFWESENTPECQVNQC